MTPIFSLRSLRSLRLIKKGGFETRLYGI
jgi:hypothetical protein